jgi:hypothetical protein
MKCLSTRGHNDVGAAEGARQIYVIDGSASDEETPGFCGNRRFVTVFKKVADRYPIHSQLNPAPVIFNVFLRIRRHIFDPKRSVYIMTF